MRQLSLQTMLSASGGRSERDSDDTLACYDLFCGCGGWSTGAEEAGHRVVFACDAWDTALVTHAANHPNAQHRRAQLPCANLPFPTDGRRFHVHGSPPCTMFSSARTKEATSNELGRATDLVEWYLETALSSGATSWSMEQVPARPVLEIVERVRRAHRARMDYGVFNLYDLGVPQRRKRLIAGSPALVARLKRLVCHSRRRSVRDVLPQVRGTHIRSAKRWLRKDLRPNRQPGESKYVYTKTTDPFFDSHSVDGPGPVVTCNGSMQWVDKNLPKTQVLQQLYVGEFKALQTFPESYRLPRDRKEAYRLLGNAVPPLVARLMMGGAARPARASPSLARPASVPVWPARKHS